MIPSKRQCLSLGNTEQIEKYFGFYKEGFSVDSFEL